MKRNTKRKQQHNCDVAKIIDTVEKAAETALKIYRIVKAIRKKWREDQMTRSKWFSQFFALTVCQDIVFIFSPTLSSV